MEQVIQGNPSRFLVRENYIKTWFPKYGLGFGGWVNHINLPIISLCLYLGSWTQPILSVSRTFLGVHKPKSILLCCLLSFGFNLLSKTIFSIFTLSIWEFLLRRNEEPSRNKLFGGRMIANIARSLDLYCVSLSELYQQCNNYLFLHQARLRQKILIRNSILFTKYLPWLRMPWAQFAPNSWHTYAEPYGLLSRPTWCKAVVFKLWFLGQQHQHHPWNLTGIQNLSLTRNLVKTETLWVNLNIMYLISLLEDLVVVMLKKLFFGKVSVNKLILVCRKT